MVIYVLIHINIFYKINLRRLGPERGITVLFVKRGGCCRTRDPVSQPAGFLIQRLISMAL
jgi:hypothetical protein